METKGVLFDSISRERARHGFPAVAIIDLLVSNAACRGCSVLWGDNSNNVPLGKRDSGKGARDDYLLDHERPPTRFMVTITGLGIVAFKIGVVLLLLYS